jgi:hypothetical protein
MTNILDKERDTEHVNFRAWYVGQYGRTNFTLSLRGGYTDTHIDERWDVWLASAALSRQPVPSRELPPLPDPIGEIVGTQFNGSEFFGCFQNEYKPVEKLRIYTADQMREYAALCAQPSREVVAWAPIITRKLAQIFTAAASEPDHGMVPKDWDMAAPSAQRCTRTAPQSKRIRRRRSWQSYA